MRRTIATIDLDHLAWNLQVIRRQAKGAKVLGMVKANAYGHGLSSISKALEELSIDMLGVAFVHEAETLRSKGVTTPILVVTPIAQQDAKAIVKHGLDVVLCEADDAHHVSRVAASAGVTIRMHLYIDTGMHRDGMSPHEAVDVLQEVRDLPGIVVSGICTHFATAFEHNSAFMFEQLETFNTVLQACQEVGHSFEHIHAANSGSLFQAPETHFTMVRPGLSLYGYSSIEGLDTLVRPIMSLSTKVSAVRRIRAGETVSYGRQYMASSETTIATIPIGYGDGYLRALTGKSSCLIHGKEYPIVGIICMDACMVDVGDDPVEVGDAVVLLGSQADSTGKVRSIDANDLAERARTVSYEITTAISERVPRSYIGELASVVGTNEVSRV